MRPVIGITTYVEEARWGAWQLDAALVPAAYVRAVERAGGRPLLVPPSLEGVGETHAETKEMRPERDAAELALLEGALARDMPTLAICRGSQVLNVARGGDLVQHLPDVVGDEKHKQTSGVFSEHEVSVVHGSRLGSLFDKRVEVKSHHHQGYGKIGDGLRVVAWADDGTV